MNQSNIGMNEICMDDINTAGDVIYWASQLERKYDIPFEDRYLLISATIEFVEKIKPLYYKYNKGGNK